MTAEERSQFNLFGCVSRCIIRASVIAGKPITLEDFASRFASFFPANEFGLLSLNKACQILVELGLCEDVYSVRNVETAKNAIRGGQLVFVLTDLKLVVHSHHIAELYHCRLAMDWADNRNSSESGLEMLLFSPSQDGTAEDRWTPFQRLEAELVHFLILA